MTAFYTEYLVKYSLDTICVLVSEVVIYFFLNPFVKMYQQFRDDKKILTVNESHGFFLKKKLVTEK